MKRNPIVKFAALLVMCCLFFGCKPEDEIEKFGTIYGTVTDFASGEPVSNANVKLRPNGETTLTGNDGTYEFIDLEAGKYSLLLSKAQYADLDDDYIIELEAGKQVKRDVQLRKKVASLKIVDMSGNPLDTLDFGDAESVKVKTFNVFNDGTETLTCTATYDCEWIANVSGLENQIQSGQTAPVTVRIDRVALADGVNTTFLYITSANGSNELVVKASFLGMPAITTKEPTEVMSNSATVAGKITDDGGRPVLVRGICYGTSQSPDISGNHTEDGSGTGDFGHNITGLSSATTYYARAYATNRNGTYYASNIVSFTTTSGLPTVVTDNVTNITTTTAKCGGNVTNNGGYNVTARGICWNTIGGPDLNDQHTTNGSGNGAFTANLTGLEPYVTYYVRAYATNQVGTSYGEEMSFTTNDGSITVTTNSVSDITPTSATCGGVVTVSSGNTFPVTTRGVCWSTSHNPSTSDSHTSDGSGAGSFTSSITGLTVNTTYYVRAYATNQQGTFYGEEKSFTTNDGSVTVTTNSVSNVTPTSAMCGGNITVPSGNTFPITARGVCWSTDHNPTTNDTHTSDGTGAGAFTSSIIGLSVNTTYYVRAYATNQQNTYYGEEKSFNTTSGLPTVITKSITDIAPLSATGGGNVTSDNGFQVTARGICWSTVANPTIYDQHTTNGTGTGEFNSAISSLQNSTTYHVRAYATNSKGTAYGEDKTFTTTSGAITVTTNSVTGIGPSSATCGGNATVTADNNLPITAKGVCWSTGHDPTVSNSHTTDGTGPGMFTSTISGLAVNTLYYVRAYATNQLGTYYGAEKSFTTTVGLPSVTTTEPTLNGATVTTGGNVTSDGGYTVTARGVCYGPLPNPDLSSTYQHTNNGSGTGYFSSTFPLPGGSGRYYIRAYATNANGTVYGEQKSIIQPYDELPTFQFNGNTYRVATEANNTLNWSDANAYCENLTLYGYSDWRLPTKEELLQMYNDRVSIGGFGYNTYWSGTFAYNAYGTNYYWAVQFSNGFPIETSEGSSKHVRPIRQETGGGTTPVPPTVTTSSPTSVNTNSATAGGNVTSDGGANVTQRGVCYSTSPNPTTSSQTVSGGSGTGSFTCNLTGLTANTTYYVRAYAINSAGTAYGSQHSFTTSGVPTITTSVPSNVTSNSAICGGNVTSDGGATVTQRGVCYSTSQNPTTSSQTVSGGSGTGSFTCNLTGLMANTTYYVRAYAINSAGTAYGSEQNFITQQVPSYTISVSSSPANGGSVTGGGTYQQGQSCTVQATANAGYTFTNWTENGVQVSTNENYTFTVMESRTLIARFTLIQAPAGAINALFTINANGDQVYFSQGNLQYNKTTQVWSFMEHQYDMVETPDQIVGENYANQNIVSLFGWGTSGYNHGAECYQPWSTTPMNSCYYAYGSGTYNLYNQTGMADWGFNSISNGGNTTNIWRTLTRLEWSYVFNTRTTNSGIRYAKAQVNNVNGVILLPDDWSSSYYGLNGTNNGSSSFSGNVISSSVWISAFESHGAVFLPAAGGRSGFVGDVGYSGYYWSSSRYNNSSVYYVTFNSSQFFPQFNGDRYMGYSVRLVYPAQ